MDPELHSDDEYTSPSVTDEQEFTSHGGGMFAGSQNFVVAGGTFTNLTTNYVTAPAVPTDLRMIPLGDIDLQQQLVVESGSGVIGRTWERRYVRRVYSAKLRGRQSNVTVAMYQGDGAEEDWREDIERYMNLRHPNIVQVCGGARHGNIHATVFHGDLVPLKQYMARRSPIMTVYLYAYFSHELTCASYYLCEMLQRRSFSQADHQIRIRRSTGRLCMDLIPPSTREPTLSPGINERIASVIASSCQLNQDAEAIESLTIEDYHYFCFWSLGVWRRTHIAPSKTVSFGAVVRSRDHADAEIIAASVDLDVVVGQFKWRRNHRDRVEEDEDEEEEDEDEEEEDEEDGIEDRWTRYQADDVFDAEFSVSVSREWSRSLASAWLSQAHHVLTCRQANMYHWEDYFVIHDMMFILSISGNTTPPPGNLFLCPPKAFKTGPSTFKWPDCPAYWSLDPSGVDRLSTEDATRLGFPSMKLRTEIGGITWDASVYAGLRQFHEAKGFDPDSQDLARHLGHPLYRVSGAIDLPFAHAEEIPVAEVVVNDEESSAAQIPNDLTEDEPTNQTGIFCRHSDRDTEDLSVGSLWFKLVMNTQLALIFFLFICQMYDQLY